MQHPATIAVLEVVAHATIAEQRQSDLDIVETVARVNYFVDDETGWFSTQQRPVKAEGVTASASDATKKLNPSAMTTGKVVYMFILGSQVWPLFPAMVVSRRRSSC